MLKIKKFLKHVAQGFVLTFSLCCLRTYYFLDEYNVNSFLDEIPPRNISIDELGWSRFAKAIRIPTISHDADEKYDEAKIEFAEFIKKEYSEVFESSYIDLQVVERQSILITVHGTDARSTPYLLMGHTDVVPVDHHKWTRPPFVAEEENGSIYGRGTIDCKVTVIGIMESLLEVVRSKNQPRKNFFVAFGHDEEVGGDRGAKNLAGVLRKRGVTELEYIIDEGMPIVKNMIPGIKENIAIIGVAEKGFISLNMSVYQNPGHSSMPPKQSSIGIMSKAVQRLEESPMPSKLDEITQSMFETVGRKMKFPLNVIFTNIWLFRQFKLQPLILLILQMKQTTVSLIRTTTAVTMIKGGTKTNVLPSHAWSVVNFRIHPLSTTDQVIESVRRIINDDRVQIDIYDKMYHFNPSPISPHNEHRDSPYHLVKSSYFHVYDCDDTIVAPGTMVANTDTKHYLDFTNHVFRLYPIVLTSEDVKGIHGHDENISKTNFQNTVKFYHALIRNSDLVDFDQRPADWSLKKEL